VLRSNSRRALHDSRCVGFEPCQRLPPRVGLGFGVHVSIWFIYTPKHQACQAESGLISSSSYVHMFSMARPKKPKAQQKGETIHVKATKEQKRTLTEKAQRANVPLSTWLLNLGLAAPE
jgi:hypothetical protein